jgi:hypothetical protein
LLDNALRDKVDDMRKATRSVGRAREFCEEDVEFIDHGVIVGGVVASDAQNLHM